MLGNKASAWVCESRNHVKILGMLVGLGATSCGAEADSVDPAENVAQTSLAETSHVFGGNWACPSGSACEDIYNVDIPADTDVTLTVLNTTSTIRLGLYEGGNPAVSGSSRNSLTGTFTSDRRCSPRPATDKVTVRVPTANRYQLVIGRDPIGSTSDGKGTYNVSVDANRSFTRQSPTLTSVVTNKSTQCLFTYDAANVWSCGNSACQDTYDLSVFPGTKLTLALAPPRAVPRMAVFGQFSSLAGTNLLTGRTVDRKCKGAGQTDSTSLIAADGGIYHVVFGRDSVATGGEGYSATIQSSDTAFIPAVTQTQNDAVSQQAGALCGYSFVKNASWSCASGSCQNTYDFDSSLSTRVDVSVTNVTGSSRTRESLVNNNRTTNSLNGLTNDRQCAGPNGSDSVSSPTLATGRQRVSVGHHNAGSGNYTATISTPDVPLVPRGQTVTNGTPFFATTSCP
jgi:hypothetical protein